MKERLLFVYDSMMLGGTTTALLSLINMIDQKKYEINLLLYTNTGVNIDEIPDFVRVLPQAYNRKGLLNSRIQKIIKTIFSSQIFYAIKSYFKYKNTSKGNFRKILMHYGMKAQVSLSRDIKEKYDVAIGFMEGWSNQYVASSKINAKKKYIWIHPQYKSCYLIPEIDQEVFKTIDKIVLISEECIGQFLEFFPQFKEKVKVIPNIISPKMLYKKSLAEKVFVQKAKVNFCTVCRCDINVKGLDRLLKAFYELKKEGLCDNILWHIIGDGPDYKKFRNEVIKLDMENLIIFYGNQKNPLPYLLEMDVFILGSRYEGKPVAITEAQILGLPCLVTNYEAASSQIEHGYNGLIMSNNYIGIYKSIKFVLKNPIVLNEWKENTLKINYGNENEITKFYELINWQKEKK